MLKWIRKASVLLGCSAILSGSVSAADLKILPGDVTLTGPHAAQRLLVAAEEGGAVVGDRTAQAKFTSANPAVAAVDGGVVRPVGDGETTITASVDGKQATAKVKVVQPKEAIDWSFRNHVIPMLTRVGCNSGACHGALAGKGGLKLSLRGYDPEADHFVLTRQALGRRVDLLEPAKQPAPAQADPGRAARRRPEAGGRLARLPAPRRLDRRRRPGPAGGRPGASSGWKCCRPPPSSSRRTRCKCWCGPGTPTAIPRT